MKKHKSVVAILLAVMMIFTMMPMMAFAASEAPAKTVWAEDGTSVTVTFGSGTTAKTGTLTNATIERTWNEGTGKVDARAFYGPSVNYDTLGEVEKMAYDALSDGLATFNYSYFDLGAAKVTNAQDYKTYTYAQFYNGTSKKVDEKTGEISGQGIGVYLSAPTYVKDYESDKNLNPVALSDNTLETAVYAAGFTKDSYADMPVTLSATVMPTDAAGQAGQYTKAVGILADNNITVQGKVPAASDVKFGIDNLKTAGAFPTSAEYDGKEHKIVAAEVPGLSVAYQVWNKTKKAWEDVSAITFKDAATMTVRYQVYKTTDGIGTAWVQTTFTVSGSTAAPSVAFTNDQAVTWTFVTGKYDPWDYVEVSGAVADSDKAALLAYFKAAYTIEETASSKFDETAYTWKFKAVDPAPKTEDYAILANYAAPAAATDSQEVTILAEDPDYNYEIEFTKAVTKKTFKANKKGKLAKNKSLTVKAEASNGATVAYKLVNVESPKISINKTNGKITFKKGLKKGTYKVKVKAYIPGYGNEFFEYQTITVKVKK